MAKLKLEKKEQYELISLKWIDAQSIDSPLCFPEDLPEKPSICEIVGYLVKQTKENYYLAKEVWDTGQCKYIHIIPKKYVTEVYELVMARRVK